MEKSTEPPEIGEFYGFDHMLLWVSNAKQAASYLITRFGFQPYAYKGLETGTRDSCTHVVRCGEAFLAFCSPINGRNDAMHDFISTHGDFVRDVAFQVDDVTGIYNKATSRGAISVRAPEQLRDEHGTVEIASIRTYGDVIHTFINRDNYKGTFLPGFVSREESDPINELFPPMNLLKIDHFAGNLPVGDLVPTGEWYAKMLDWHRFWTVDDDNLDTELTSMNTFAMSDWHEVVKMAIGEPAPGRRKSHIEEYVAYNHGAGVQHVAFLTEDIVEAITQLRARGMQFLSIPNAYYDLLKKRLEDSPITVKEDIEDLRKLNILVDFDDEGYLLQIFTKVAQDRPTLFYEVIQRRNNPAFGIGNIKSLVEAIEFEQSARNNS